MQVLAEFANIGPILDFAVVETDQNQTEVISTRVDVNK